MSTVVDQSTPHVSGTMVAMQYLALPLVLLIRGYVAAIFWQWFIVPLFEVNALTVVQAIGVILLVFLVTPNSRETPRDDNAVKQQIAVGLSWPLVTLFLGWLVHLFA